MATRFWHNSWIHEFMISWIHDWLCCNTTYFDNRSKELTKRNVFTGGWTLSNWLKFWEWQDPDTIHDFMNSWIHEFMTDYVATPHILIKTDLRNLPKGMSILDDKLWVTDWKSGNDNKILTQFMNSWIHEIMKSRIHE